jgi:hypothetical protein
LVLEGEEMTKLEEVREEIAKIHKEMLWNPEQDMTVKRIEESLPEQAEYLRKEYHREGIEFADQILSIPIGGEVVAECDMCEVKHATKRPRLLRDVLQEEK